MIFVLLDGCRWDRTNISNDFKELQSEGTFFNNVTAAIPYTAGAVNVIFSGLYGKDNGIDAYSKLLALKKSIKVLPEILQEKVYRILLNFVLFVHSRICHRIHILGEFHLLLHHESNYDEEK